MAAVTKNRRIEAVTSRPNSLRGNRVNSRPAVMHSPDDLLPADTAWRFAAGGRSNDGYERATGSSSAQAARPAVAPSVRTRPSRSLRISRLLHGESLVIGTFLACFLVFCVVGIAFLGVYANVQCLAVELQSEQGKLAEATARQHDLMDRIGRLSSPDLVAAKAPTMNMELPTAHAFVDAPATSAGQIHSAQMAEANVVDR